MFRDYHSIMSSGRLLDTNCPCEFQQMDINNMNNNALIMSKSAIESYSELTHSFARKW